MMMAQIVKERFANISENTFSIFFVTVCVGCRGDEENMYDCAANQLNWPVVSAAGLITVFTDMRHKDLTDL